MAAARPSNDARPGAARDDRGGFEKINPIFREAVVLRDITDLSYEEIAEILGVSLGTVKSRILRGREALREELARESERQTGLAIGAEGGRVKSMSCENVQELISSFLDRSGAEGDRETVLVHARSCRQCGAVLEFHQNLRPALRKMERAPRSADLTSKFTCPGLSR